MDIVFSLVAFFLGVAATVLIQRVRENLIEAGGRRQSREILEEARLQAASERTELLLSTKEEIDELREEFDRDTAARERDLKQMADKLQKRESNLDRRQSQLKKQSVETQRAREEAEAKEKQYAELLEEEKKSLERVSGLSLGQAREIFLEKVGQDLEMDVAIRLNRVEKRFREEAMKKGREIVAEAVQRCTAGYEFEPVVSVVNLPNDEMKGRIIGKEGRNIRAFEAITGMNLVVDETPESVVISGFNPLKREIARVALERLLSDGRITPTNIEKAYEKARKEVHDKVRHIGKDALRKIKIGRVHPELVFEIGKFNYRASYGQNLLHHTFEVANLATLLANELGEDPKICRRAAFLHDLGKVSESDAATHAILGMQLAKKLGEKPIIVNAIGAHHQEVEQESVAAVIVEVADALSAARPGARRDTLESYIKRIEGLETIARSYKGVEDVYAIQAGREVRVIVNPKSLDDMRTGKLASDIAKRIEDEIEYPGHVKVVCIRETRSVATATR